MQPTMQPTMQLTIQTTWCQRAPNDAANDAANDAIAKTKVTQVSLAIYKLTLQTKPPNHLITND